MQVLGEFQLEDGLGGVFLGGKEVSVEILAFPTVKDRIRIRETGRIDTLYIINENDLPVIVIDGEALEGGYQNRTLRHTVVLDKGVNPVPVFCIERGRWTSPGGSRNYERALRTNRDLMEILQIHCSDGIVNHRTFSRMVYRAMYELWKPFNNAIKRRRYINETGTLVKIMYLILLYRGYLNYAIDVPDEIMYISKDEILSYIDNIPLPEALQERFREPLKKRASQIGELPLLQELRNEFISPSRLCSYGMEILERYRNFYERMGGEANLFSSAGILPYSLRMMKFMEDQGIVWEYIDTTMRSRNFRNPTSDFVKVVKHDRKDIPDIQVPEGSTGVIFTKENKPIVYEEIAHGIAFRDYFSHMLSSFYHLNRLHDLSSMYLDKEAHVEDFLKSIDWSNTRKEYKIGKNTVFVGGNFEITDYMGEVVHRVYYNLKREVFL